MFINPKKPSCTLNLNLVSISVSIYILGVILSFINTPTHTFASIHIARHTFASLSLSNHVPIESISKMLGHSDIRTTQIYAKTQDKTVYEDMATMRQKFDCVLMN